MAPFLSLLGISGAISTLIAGAAAAAAEPGQQAYTSSGTFTFTVPDGVTQVSAVVIGAGGGAGGTGSNRGGGG